MYVRFVGALALVAIFAGASAHAEDRSPPTVSVVGVAEDDVRPDIATIALDVSADRPTANDAEKENARLSTLVIDGLKGSGIDAKDISTIDVRLAPILNEERDPKSGQVVKSVVTGFRASNYLSVRLHDVSRAGAIIGASVQNGALYQGLTFDISDREAREDELRGKAAANARRRATLYAEGAGAKLGAIRSLSADAGVYRPVAAMFKTAAVAGSPAPLPVEPGEIRLSETVNATWELATP